MHKDKIVEPKLIYIKSILYKLINLIEFQLILMLFSWPILLCWGLPLSLMAPFANIIFVPFLSLFILISSFIFFTELLLIPNNFLIKILDFLSKTWFYLLSKSSKFWLISCKYPGAFYLFLIILFAVIIIFSKRLTKPIFKIGIILSFMSLCLINFKYIKNNKLEIEIPICKKNILFLKQDNYTIVIDKYGALSQNISPFFLMTNFIKNGAYKIDHLIIPKPSSTCFKSISDLLTIIDIKNIYIPKFKANLNNTGWKNWQYLLEQVNKYEISLQLTRVR